MNEFSLEFVDLKVNSKTSITVIIKDTNNECVVCKRRHDYLFNRTSLNICQNGDVCTLGCRRQYKGEQNMPSLPIKGINSLNITQ